MELPESITKTLYITLNTSQYGGSNIGIYDWDIANDNLSSSVEYINICTHEFTIDLPEGFKPEAAIIECLEKQIEEETESYKTKIRLLNRRIEEVRALPSPTCSDTEEA